MSDDETIQRLKKTLRDCRTHFEYLDEHFNDPEAGVFIDEINTVLASADPANLRPGDK